MHLSKSTEGKAPRVNHINQGLGLWCVRSSAVTNTPPVAGRLSTCKDRFTWETCVPFPQFCSKKLGQKLKKKQNKKYICTMVLELVDSLLIKESTYHALGCDDDNVKMKFRLLNIYFYVLFLLCHRLETNSSRTTLWTALKECLNSRLKRGIRMCKYERVCGLLRNRKIQYG